MKLRLIRIIAIALLAVSGFVTIGLLELFGRAPERLAVPVPNAASWILRADATTILKEEAFTVLFEEQDEQLIKTLRALAENTIGKAEKPKLFINIFSEMILFGTEKNHHKFTGILLQLDNPELFEKNIPSYLKANQSFAVRGSTALILTRTDKENFDRNEQNALAASLLQNSSPVSGSKRERKLNEWISLEVKNSGKLQNADIGVLFNRNDVSLEGTARIKGEVKMPHFDVKHENFYVNSAFVPEDLPTTLFAQMQLGNLTFPPLENISVSYGGLVIENGSSLFRLPEMNAVLTTKTVIRVEDLMSQVPEKFRTADNKLRFSSKVYYLIQLDPHTIFFGVDPKSVLRKSPESPLMVTGDLQKLAAIEADGMIMTGISMLVPQYNVVSTFTKETEKAELKLVPQGKDYKLTGTLKFRDNKSALAMITRLFLGLQTLN